ncbi:MAG: LysM peptidoglycan-binding domain-containing protein [Endomicrobiales bacterium]
MADNYLRKRFAVKRKIAAGLGILAFAACLLNAGGPEAGRGAKPSVSPLSLPGIRGAMLPSPAVARSSGTAALRAEAGAPAPSPALVIEVKKSTVPVVAAAVEKSTAAVTVFETGKSTASAAALEVKKSTFASVSPAGAEAAAAVPAGVKADPAQERLSLTGALPVVPLARDEATGAFFKALEKLTGENAGKEASSGAVSKPPQTGPAVQGAASLALPGKDKTASPASPGTIPPAVEISSAAAPAPVAPPLSALPVTGGTTEQTKTLELPPAAPAHGPGSETVVPAGASPMLPAEPAAQEITTETPAPLPEVSGSSATPAPPAGKAPLSAGESAFPEAREIVPPPARKTGTASRPARPLLQKQLPPAAPLPAPVAEKKAVALMRAHRVAPGETLPSLAARYYGDNSDWVRIYEANKDKIEKGSLRSGQLLIIP